MKTELFDRKFEKLDKGVQQRIERIRDQLKQNPYVGKPLQLGFFREKRSENSGCIIWSTRSMPSST